MANIHKVSRPARTRGTGSSNAKLIKRTLLPPSFFPPSPNLPHFHRLLTIAYRKDHSTIRAKTALTDGARVCCDADEAAARGECVHGDGIGVRRGGRLGDVRQTLPGLPRKAMRAEQLSRMR